MIHLSGKFIVLDGPEGSGKSTQTQLLRARLESAGLGVVAVRDPGATRIGEQIRNILLDPAHTEMGMRCEMLLYMSARAQMMSEIILPALAAGKVVLCDRFVSSTLAYQSGGDGITAKEIREVGHVAIQARWPDLTLILDMPVEQSFARIHRKKDRIEQRPIEYHEQVRRNYLQQAADDPARVRVINANQAKDIVEQDIWKIASGMG